MPTDMAIAKMRAALEEHLEPPAPPGPPPDPPPPPLPAHGLSLVSVTERTVGLGNRRGMDTLGPFAVLALKGLRLEAVVRYQYWGRDPAEADALVSGLQGRLVAAADDLRAEGFLRVKAEGTSLAEHVAPPAAWRRTADYNVLFEFRYQDTDGAESLIARIPLDYVGEFVESTSVSDAMVMWDKVEAPSLKVRRGRAREFPVGALTALASLPDGWDGTAGVTLKATSAGATVEKKFASVRAFFDALKPAPAPGEDPEPDSEPVLIGGKPYLARQLNFPNEFFPDPLVLRGDEDEFGVSYGAQKFEVETGSEGSVEPDAVVYLRVLRGTG